MMTVIPGLATAASRATAAADRDPHSASRGPAVVKANAFLTVDGDHVRVAEDGGIVYDRDAEGSFTVSARSGWLVEGRETLTVPYSAERPRALKVTGLTGEDGTEVPVEPDDEEEPEEEEDYTLSIECDRYLGLDRTDSGRLGHTVKTATATLDPECEGATVTWISCGSLCEFVEGDRVVTKPTGWTVSYRNKDPDTPSTEVDAEELVAEVTIPGKDGTIRASKRFTVVKVDVKVGDLGEDKEESVGGATMFRLPRRKNGNLDWSTVKSYAVQFEIKPDSLPGDESMDITSGNFPDGMKMLHCDGLDAKDSYPLSELPRNGCSIVLPYRSTKWNDRYLMLTHGKSGAKDKLCMTCFGIELVCPSGDPVGSPDEKNEFTYDDTTQTLTVPFRVRIMPKPTETVAGRISGTFTAGDVGGTTCVWKTPSGKKIGDGLSASVSAGADGFISANAVFSGYPESNDSFGKKKAKFTRGKLALENDYEVFFPKYGRHHPACEKCPDCPNWFYYWKQGQACEMPTYTVYGGELLAQYGEWNPEVVVDGENVKILPRIIVYDKAAEDSGEVKYAVSKLDERRIPLGRRRRGVGLCAAVVVHEMQHKKNQERCRVDVDTDSDRCSDEDEAGSCGLTTHTGWRDTFDVAQVLLVSEYARYGDDEVRCRWQETKSSVDKRYHIEKDWANPGCQHKDPYGPF